MISTNAYNAVIRLIQFKILTDKTRHRVVNLVQLVHQFVMKILSLLRMAIGEKIIIQI